MQTPLISLRKTSTCIPATPIAQQPSEHPVADPCIKAGLSQACSIGNVVDRNVLEASEKIADLEKLAERSRSTKELSQRSQNLQAIAKAYLEAIEALEPLAKEVGIQEELSKHLAKLLEEDLLPMYCIGYLKAEWFQDYRLYMENLLNLRSLDTVTGNCLKEYYDIQSGSYQWCKSAEGSFEIQAEKMVQEQIHFLISSLRGDRDGIASRLWAIENVLKELLENYPVRLGFHSMGNVFIFLIRQGSSRAIDSFLDTYKLAYTLLKKEKLGDSCFVPEIHALKSTLSLCLGWRRFFSLNATHLLSICDLSDTYSMRTHPLTALYLENIKLFQAACQKCYQVIEKELQKKGMEFLSKESYLADLVSCLSIALITVNNWTEDTFCKLGTSSYSANISIQEDARALKSTIAEESSGLLECIAQIYLESPRQEHKQAAEAIRGFLRKY